MEIEQEEVTLPTTMLRETPLGQDLPTIAELRIEISEYIDCLLGRVRPPINYGVMTLLEYASAVHARALEINALIHQGELNGYISRGSAYYRFRTGELRDFTEMASKAADLGSRRITYLDMQSRLKENSP